VRAIVRVRGATECDTYPVAEGGIMHSPGVWQAPSGARPAWNWVPPDHGLTARLDRVPPWVRVWFRTPFVDRFAYTWMWDHGGWDIVPHHENGPGSTGDKAPLVPHPSPPRTRLERPAEGA